MNDSANADKLVKWSFDANGIFIGHSQNTDTSEINFTNIYGRGEKVYTLSLTADKSY